MTNQIIRQWSIALVAVLSLATSLPALAQYHTTAGQSAPASGNYDGGSRRFVFGGSLSFWHNEDAKRTSVSLSPDVMYLISNQLGIGANFSLQNKSKDGENSTTYFLLRPFLRYHFGEVNPLRFFIEGGLGVSSGGGKTGFEIGVRPGLDLALSRLVHLNMTYGFLGYRNKFAFSEAEGTGSTGFGLAFTPASLSIGIEFHL